MSIREPKFSPVHWYSKQAAKEHKLMPLLFPTGQTGMFALFIIDKNKPNQANDNAHDFIPAKRFLVEQRPDDD